MAIKNTNKAMAAKSADRALGNASNHGGAVMAGIRYVAVPCEPELIAAIEESCKKSGLKLGPEAAMRLRKVYKIGPFAQKKEAAA